MKLFCLSKKCLKVLMSAEKVKGHPENNISAHPRENALFALTQNLIAASSCMLKLYYERPYERFDMFMLVFCYYCYIKRTHV